jgi:hypothetical protein
MKRLGFFSEYLAIGMSGERLTSKELARKLECSYEYVRAFVQGRSLPSARLQSRLCKVFGWSETKLRKLVMLDQMRRRLGHIFWEEVGVKPESRFQEFYVLWEFLDDEGKDFFEVFLRALVARKPMAHLGGAQ